MKVIILPKKRIIKKKKDSVKIGKTKNLKLFKISDDAIAVTNSNSLNLVTLEKNRIIFNRSYEFTWENIYILSNGKIIASIYNNNRYNIKELVYDKKNEAVEVKDYNLFNIPKDESIASLLELSGDRLISFAENKNTIKIWDVAYKWNY